MVTKYSTVPWKAQRGAAIGVGSQVPGRLYRGSAVVYQHRVHKHPATGMYCMNDLREGCDVAVNAGVSVVVLRATIQRGSSNEHGRP